MRRDGAVRLVEVKARRDGDPSGLESVGPDKQRRLRRAGEAWLLGDAPREIAFMVAVVTLNEGVWALELIDDAF